MNGDISVGIKPIKRTTGRKSSAFVGGFNTIGTSYCTINWNLHTPASLAINPQVGY
jgi:hypothetical protein